MGAEITIRDRAFRARIRRIRERCAIALREVAAFEHWSDSLVSKSYRFTPLGRSTKEGFDRCRALAEKIYLEATTAENETPGGWTAGLPVLGSLLEELGQAAQTVGIDATNLSAEKVSGGLPVDPTRALTDIGCSMLLNVGQASLMDALWCARADREREREETQNSDAYRKARSRKRHAAGYRSFRAELHADDIRTLRDLGLLVGDLDDKLAVEVALDGLIQTAMAAVPAKEERERRILRPAGEPETTRVYAAVLERLADLARFDRV